MDGLATHLVEWAGVTRPGSAHAECGIAFSVTTAPHGVLVAVAQGLGSGSEAAVAARAAVAVARTNALVPLPLIIHNCHRELHDGAGAAISLALFDARRPLLWWLGVGHVPGYVMPARRGSQYRPLPLQPGVVGQEIPSLVATTRPLALHDTLIIVSDSVRWDPARAPGRADIASEMARRLIDEYGSQDQDAAVVTARYLGAR